jgi:hypothetical protein
VLLDHKEIKVEKVK